MTTTPEPVSLDLAPDAASVARARSAVRDAAGGLRREVVDDAELLVSELVSNAVRHGGGSIRLTIAREFDDLIVSVFDAGPGLPVARSAEPDRTVASGRGLRMVQQLAAAWGVEADALGQGKTVWFRILTGAGDAIPGQITEREDRAPWSSSSRGATTTPGMAP